MKAPKLRVLGNTEFYDVKFYPYSPEGSNPIFAAVTKQHVCDSLVCFLPSRFRPGSWPPHARENMVH